MKSDTEIAKEMADVLLHVAVYFRLETWERDLTEEEYVIACKVKNALDNPFGRAARQAVSDAIARDTERALAKMEGVRG